MHHNCKKSVSLHAQHIQTLPYFRQHSPLKKHNALHAAETRKLKENLHSRYKEYFDFAKLAQ
jgi:hypothetical protein